MGIGKITENKEDGERVQAERHSPSGGLRAIRLKNGWDDSKPPVLGPDFQPMLKGRKPRFKGPVVTFEDRFSPAS